MKKSSVSLMVVLLLLVSVLSACGGTSGGASGGGDGSLDRVKKASKLLVAIDATYPPMEFMDKDGKTPVGFDVDFAKEIAKKLGVQVEFVVSDWDGIIPGLKAKKYDMIMSSMNVTDERKKEVNFVEYVKMSQVFVVKKGGATVKTEKDLAGKTVAVQAETTSQEWVEGVKKDKVKDIKDIKTYKAATDTFNELKAGRVDVIVIDEPVGRYYANLDSATFAIGGVALAPEPVGIAIRKEDKDLLASVEKAVKDLKADGTYKKLSDQWFGGELGK